MCCCGCHLLLEVNGTRPVERADANHVREERRRYSLVLRLRQLLLRRAEPALQPESGRE